MSLTPPEKIRTLQRKLYAKAKAERPLGIPTILLRGWQAYFGYGTLSRVYGQVNWYVADRARHFLRRRHKVPTRGTRQFSTAFVFVDSKVHKLSRKPSRAATPHAFA